MGSTDVTASAQAAPPSPAPPHGAPSCERQLVWLTLVICGYFYNGANWNHNARFDVIFAFVEPGNAESGAFVIDRFLPAPADHFNTGDWATHGGRYYSNKAPGPALLGVPIYAGLYWVERCLDWTVDAPAVAALNAFLLNFVISVLPIALACGAFFRMLMRSFGLASSLARLATLYLATGTMLWPFSTQLWGHATATAMLIFTLERLLRCRARHDFQAGLFAGLAVLCEYYCAISVIVFAIGLLLERRPRSLLPFIAGGIGPLIVHGLYHHACFGSMWAMAPAFNNPFFTDDRPNLAGFGIPSWSVIYAITFSQYRGLFVYMPIMLASLLTLLFHSRRLNPMVRVLAWGNFLGYLTMNACFYGWGGGATAGPRYQISAIPFLILALATGPLPVGAVMHRFLYFVSTFFMLLCVSITPCPAPEVRNPLLTFAGQFFHSDWVRASLPIRLQPVGSPESIQFGSFNLGELLGLTGIWSLIPLAIVVGLILKCAYDGRE